MNKNKYLSYSPTRRALLATAAAWPALAWTHAVFGQSKQAPVLIGWLSEGSRQAWANRLAAFKEGLAALGWKEGLNFVLEERWSEGRVDQLRPLAEALAAKKPVIIVAGPSQAVAAAAKAAPRTPIVVAAGDPLAAGLVSNLARPNGMITGVTNIVAQVNQKHLELLLDAVPKLRRIGFLVDSNSPTRAGIMEAARHSAVQLSVEGVFAEVVLAEEIDAAISRLAKEGVHALVVTASPIFLSERKRIAKLAAVHRWPFVVGQGDFAEDGALLTYGADRLALFRRAAYYADKILKGAKPGDLPIEQPTKFELVVNLKTAKALGITIPQSILVRADRVIE